MNQGNRGISYRLGFWVRRFPAPLALALGAVLLVLAWPVFQPPPPAPPAPVKQVAAPVPSVVAVVDTTCTSGLDAVVAQARALTAKGQAKEAFDALYPCREQLRVGPHAPYYRQAWDAADAATNARLKKEMAEEKARRKREGVSLGMTQEDALASSWGKPHHINRTTTLTGEREQWVYQRGVRNNYLYFDNDILTAIQN